MSSFAGASTRKSPGNLLESASLYLVVWMGLVCQVCLGLVSRLPITSTKGSGSPIWGHLLSIKSLSQVTHTHTSFGSLSLGPTPPTRLGQTQAVSKPEYYVTGLLAKKERTAETDKKAKSGYPLTYISPRDNLPRPKVAQPKVASSKSSSATDQTPTSDRLRGLKKLTFHGKS